MAGDKSAVVAEDVKEEVKKSVFEKLNDWGCKSTQNSANCASTTD